jgi:DNA-binding MarR family transcriptional regulator
MPMPSNPGDLDCTCYRLRQTTRLVSRTYDLFLAQCGMSIGQFGMLSTLKAMEGESISRLAEVLHMDRTTLTRNLSPLQKCGYVVVEGGADKRSRALRLTNAGKKALANAKPKWRAAQTHLEGQLGHARIELLNRTLDNTLGRISNG